MRQLIAGNWKMNGRRDSATRLIEALRDGLGKPRCEVLLCPAFPHLSLAASLLTHSPIMLGAQDCHAETDGAYTGDVSAEMLRDAGARWVIVGHSERRRLHGETSDQVRAKAAAAQRAGLYPILAIGESAEERQQGRTEQVLGAQLRESLPDDFHGVVAYEPIWAIGTGRTPDERSVADTVSFIRSCLQDKLPAWGSQARILYGGSVTPDNAAALLALPDVGGALVGGASLNAEQFLRIVSASALLCSDGDKE